jgi:5-methylcytosine-specific restriction endonuclease McrA
MGMPELLPLDDDRQFRQEQKLAVFLRDQGICQKCRTKCKDNDWHADHVKPYSAGGKTTIGNGQVLCIKCNLEKGAKES